ncbi:MAG TPA: hypothetical protein VFF33_01455 [Ignavibacteriaceae bacterium]|nr:hypothetical protein [Ignavibacteriaceae bacterium]
MFQSKWFVKIRFLLILSLVFLINSCERQDNIVTIDDGLPPAVPQGLFVYNATDGTIDIEWKKNNEPDLKGYNVYRRTNKTDYILIASTKNYYYFDDSLEYEETYFYKVTSVDLTNLESDFSNEISAIPSNKFKPNRPNDFQAFGRNWNGRKYMFLKWMTNTESDVSYYNIYRSTVEGFQPDSTNLIGTSNISTFKDTVSIELYKTYYYKITAVDKGGLESTFSNESSDLILDLPKLVFPANNSRVRFFNNFKIITLPQPATYKVILQPNEFYGELWSNDFNSNLLNDTLDIGLNYTYFEYNTKYFWRIVTFTKSFSEPNSITDLFSFTLIP